MYLMCLRASKGYDKSSQIRRWQIPFKKGSRNHTIIKLETVSHQHKNIDFLKATIKIIICSLQYFYQEEVGFCNEYEAQWLRGAGECKWNSQPVNYNMINSCSNHCFTSVISKCQQLWILHEGGCMTNNCTSLFSVA